MTFYTAGPMHDRDYVRGVRDALQGAGFKVKADWLDIEASDDGQVTPEYLREMALQDLKDCIAADALIYCNTGYKSEGKATELGVSIAMLKPIIIVGPGGRSNNIFLNLNIPAYETVEDVITFLQSNPNE